MTWPSCVLKLSKPCLMNFYRCHKTSFHEEKNLVFTRINEKTALKVGNWCFLSNIPVDETENVENTFPIKLSNYSKFLSYFTHSRLDKDKISFKLNRIRNKRTIFDLEYS